MHKVVDLPGSGGSTRIIQPFRLKIPNRPLPASFEYHDYGYNACTSY